MHQDHRVILPKEQIPARRSWPTCAFRHPLCRAVTIHVHAVSISAMLRPGMHARGPAGQRAGAALWKVREGVIAPHDQLLRPAKMSADGKDLLGGDVRRDLGRESLPAAAPCHVEGGEAVPIGAYLYVSFVLFGISQLIPFNFYLKSASYFTERLAGSWIDGHVHKYLATSYNAGNMLTISALVLLRWDEYLMDAVGRIIVGLSLNAAMFATIAVAMVAGIPDGTLAAILLAVTFLSGCGVAFLTKGLLVMTSLFPRRMTPIFCMGQAAAGLFTNLTCIPPAIAAVSSSGLEDAHQAAYFFVGALVCSMSLAAFLANHQRSKAFRFYMMISRRASQDDQQLLGEGSHTRTPASEGLLAAQGRVESLSHKPISTRKMVAVLKRIWIMALGIMLTMAFTMSIVVQFITQKRVDAGPSAEPLWKALYSPIIYIFDDAGDIFGRWLPSVALFAGSASSKVVRLGPYLRIVLLAPLFFFFSPIALRFPSPLPFSPLDALYALIVLVFGSSHGYCLTVLLMHAPTLAAPHRPLMASLTEEPHLKQDAQLSPSQGEMEQEEEGGDREACGALMGLFLVLGHFLGAITADVWKIFI